MASYSYTISEIIQIAKVTEYLSANDVSNGALFGARVNKRNVDVRRVYTERKSVEYLYDLTPSDDTLPETSQYLLSLCGKYKNEAVRIINGAGGGTVIITPTTISPIIFYVSGSSLMVNGATTITLDGSTGTQDLRGYNMSFYRNTIIQPTIEPNDSTTYYTWVKSTAVFTLYNGAATTGELFQLNAYL